VFAQERDERVAEVAQRVDWFVRECLLDGGFEGLDPLAELYIDSLALEQLLHHLEETYRVLFTAEDIGRPNLSSVPRAAAMVDARRRAVEAGDRTW
jgi:acyl carrier protein